MEDPIPTAVPTASLPPSSTVSSDPVARSEPRSTSSTPSYVAPSHAAGKATRPQPAASLPHETLRRIFDIYYEDLLEWLPSAPGPDAARPADPYGFLPGIVQKRTHPDAYIPWPRRGAWIYRLLFIRRWVASLRRVCKAWKSVADQLQYWNYLATALDPAPPTQPRVVFNFHHAAIIAGQSCWICAVNGDSSPAAVAAAARDGLYWGRTRALGATAMCVRHFKGRRDHCSICLTEQGLSKAPWQDPAWPEAWITCTLCREDTFCGLLARETATIRQIGGLTGHDLRAHQPYAYYVQCAMGTAQDVVSDLLFTLWLQRNTKYDEFEEQARVQLRLEKEATKAATAQGRKWARRTTPQGDGQENEDLAGYTDDYIDDDEDDDDDDDDDDGDDELEPGGEEERAVRSMALEDWCVNRIKEGYWFHAAEQTLHFRDRLHLHRVPLPPGTQPIDISSATNIPDVDVNGASPAAGAHLGPPLPPLPPWVAVKHIEFAFMGALESVIKPTLTNVAATLDSAQDEAVAIAEAMTDEDLLELLRDLRWWLSPGTAADLPRLRAIRDRKDAACRRGSANGDGRSVEPERGPPEMASDKETVAQEVLQSEVRAAAAVQPWTSRLPLVPASIDDVGPATRLALVTLWKETTKRVYECRCRICLRVMREEAEKREIMAVVEKAELEERERTTSA